MTVSVKPALPVGHNAYFVIDIDGGAQPTPVAFSQRRVLSLGSDVEGGHKTAIILTELVRTPDSTVLVLVKTGRKAYFTQFEQHVIPLEAMANRGTQRLIARGTRCRSYDEFGIESIEELWAIDEDGGIVVSLADGHIIAATVSCGSLITAIRRDPLEAHQGNRIRLGTPLLATLKSTLSPALAPIPAPTPRPKGPTPEPKPRRQWKSGGKSLEALASVGQLSTANA